MSSFPPHMNCSVPGCPLPGTMSEDKSLDRSYCSFHFQAPANRLGDITKVLAREAPLVIFAYRLMNRAPNEALRPEHISYMEKRERTKMLEGIKTCQQLGTRIMKVLSDEMQVDTKAHGTNAKSDGAPDQWKKLTAQIAKSAAAKQSLFDGDEFD